MEPNWKEVERIIKAALAEDIGTGDATSALLVPKHATAALAFVTREPLMMCGGEVAARVFTMLNANVQVSVHLHDGHAAKAGDKLIDVKGPARDILSAERVALNLLARMCGIATLTSRYVKAVEGTGAIVLDTRKTMPGLREIDKYAVRAGGGRNYRMRLDDAILIKDNHVALAGSIDEAFKRAVAGNTKKLPIEIECDTLKQVEEALKAGAQNIMLDNMDLGMLREAVKLVAGRAKLEASGNITLERIREVAQTGVDFISVGRLTHSVQNVDIGLDIAVKN